MCYFYYAFILLGKHVFKNDTAKCFPCAINEYKCSGKINAHKRGKGITTKEDFLLYFIHS